MNNYNVELYVRDKEFSESKRIEFDVFQFPGGELQIRDLEIPQGDLYRVVIFVRGAAPETIIVASMLQEVVSTQMSSPYRFIMAVPYLPAARSDRGPLQALPAYTQMLLGEHYGWNKHSVAVDIHNPDAVPQTNEGVKLSNVSAVSVMRITPELMRNSYAGVIAPDEGAFDRAAEVAEEFGVPLFSASKKRDFETGKLLEFRAPEGLDPHGHYLVVDDICDGGGTFAGLAEAIKKQYGALRLKLDLWVTHGVFSGHWEKNLMSTYENVYTTNSHPNVDNINHPRVHVTDIRPFMIGD